MFFLGDQLTMSVTVDEERWNQLLSSIDKLTLSHDNLRSEINVSTKTVESLTAKSTAHDKRLSDIEETLSFLNSQIRAKNLVLFKLEDSDNINNNLLMAILGVFKNVGLQISELAVDDVFRLGKNKGARPILIKFISAKWVKLIFGRVQELSKAGFAIANNRSKEERLHRRNLLDQVHKLKGLGLDARLKGVKIIVDGSVVSAEEPSTTLKRQLSADNTPRI